MSDVNTLPFLSQYQPLAYRTAKFFDDFPRDVTHCALGMTTELGEYATSVKRIEVYGKPAEPLVANMTEELGDFVWYLALLATVCGIDLGQVDLQGSSLGNVETESQTQEDVAIFLMAGATAAAWLVVHQGYEKDFVRELLGIALLGVKLAADATGVNLQDICNDNIEKLRERFPDKYSDEAAEARADKGGLDATVS